MAPKSQKQDIPQPPPPPPPSLKVSSMPSRGRGRKHEVLRIFKQFLILLVNQQLIIMFQVPRFYPVTKTDPINLDERTPRKRKTRHSDNPPVECHVG